MSLMREGFGASDSGWTLPAVLLAEKGQRPTIQTIHASLPGPDEVAVRMVAAGICHTDIAAVRDARSVPMVLGHEGAGYVERVGANVTHVKVGDPVAINWQAKCGICPKCLAGKQDFCEQVLGTAAPRLHWQGHPAAALLNSGTFCPIAVVPTGGAVPIPRDLPFAIAAMLGCAVATGVGAALYTAKVASGESVLVLGVGAVGLNIVQGARIAGASMIIAVDRDPARLEFAQRLGATHGVVANGVSLLEQVQALTNGRGVDHVFEVLGIPDLMRQSVDMLARGGSLTLVGAAERGAEMSFAPRSFMSQQKIIRGCIYGNVCPDHDLPLFANWYQSGKLELDAMLGDRIRLDQVPEYFTDGHGQKNKAHVRTIVEFDLEEKWERN